MMAGRRKFCLLTIVFVIVLIALYQRKILKLAKQSVHPKQLHLNQLVKNDKWVLVYEDEEYGQPQETIQKLDWTVATFTKPYSAEDVTLKAIRNGARHIYVASHKDEVSQGLLDRFNLDKYMTALKYNGSLKFGLPFHFIGSENKSRSVLNINRGLPIRYVFGVWYTPPVQKFLKEGDFHNEKVVSFDYRAPSVFLPHGHYHKFRKESILFHYNSFWAIVPSMTSSYIWSIWVQRLLRELHTSPLFVTSIHLRGKKFSSNTTNETNDLSVVNKWECKNRSSFFSCVLSLTTTMVKAKLLSEHDYKNVVQWTDRLLENGYIEPRLTNNFLGIQSLEAPHAVHYHPSFTSSHLDPSHRFNHICDKKPPKCSKSITITNKRVYSNILLVIVFNRAGHYGILDHLERIYRPVFQQILYCGQDMRNFMESDAELKTRISFLEIDASFRNGELGYQCLQKAMLMNYDVDGYFHVSDDVLLNFWNLAEYPMDKIWFQESFRVANLSQPKVVDVWKNPDWWPWRTGRGQGAVARAMTTLQDLSFTEIIPGEFLDQLSLNAGGMEKVFYEVSDIYYIPQRFAKQYIYLVNVFKAAGVYHEIAVPTLIAGIEDLKNVVRLPGSYLWYDERAKFKETYYTSKVFLHPVKATGCIGDPDCRSFLCNNYLSCVFV